MQEVRRPRRYLAKLVLLALPAAAVPIALAAPAFADATPTVCASVGTGYSNGVSTSCAPQGAAPGHIIGAQVCTPPGSSDGNGGVAGDPINGMTINVDNGTVWVDAAGNASTQTGGVTAGTGSTGAGVGDDVGTQCAPGG